MQKSKIIVYSLIHALAVLGYIIGIGYGIEKGSEIFMYVGEFGGFVPMLMLFVFSAAVMAILVFGRPVYLFIGGLKREGIEFLVYTMGWILILIILCFSYMALSQPSYEEFTNYNNTQIID